MSTVLAERIQKDMYRHRKAALARSERIRADYIATVEPERLTPAGTAGAGTILMVAARVGTTRLIDNMIYGQGVP